VVGCAQRDEDVIRPKRADRVLERRQRRVVPGLAPCLRAGRQLPYVPEHGLEPIVRLVPRAVRVRCEPLKPPDEHGRDDEDLRRALDELPHVGRELREAGSCLAGRDQEAGPTGRHAQIMPHNGHRRT
jgi:hypothetical protein